jgi:colicin import membrane protein
VNTKYKPLILSVFLHFGLILLLATGDLTSTPKPMPMVSQVTPIQATIVDQAKVDNQVKKLKKLKKEADAAEKKRLRDAEKRLLNAKRKRLKEEAKIKVLERQRKNKLKEKRQADQAAKNSKAKAVAAETARKTMLAEQKKADDVAAAVKAKRIKDELEAKKIADKKVEDKRKQVVAEQKRLAQAAKERVEQDQMLQRQMAEEMAGRQQARRQQQMSEINRFTALIVQTIQRNLITDRSSMEGKSCKLTISLATSGFVTDVIIGEGDRVVCEAAQTAIYKAGTLPVSKDPEVFKVMQPLTVIMIPEF